MHYRFAVMMAAIALPTPAPAQTRDLRRDREQIRDAEDDLDRAARYGEHRDFRRARENLRDAHREYRDDWRDYRARNRGAFSRGDWRAPFRYQRFSDGATLRRNHYAPRYYIEDYRRYRLSEPPRSAAWVRHYDDVVLVHLPSGRVLDVIHDFFW